MVIHAAHVELVAETDILVPRPVEGGVENVFGTGTGAGKIQFTGY